MNNLTDLEDLHLLRPELMFRDSFRVSGPLKDSVKQCLISVSIGLVIGAILGNLMLALV